MEFSFLHQRGGFVAATALAVASGLYYVYYPETTTDEPGGEIEPEKGFKKIRLEAFSDYVGDSDDALVYWDSNEDISGWKFSRGGYFIAGNDAILPKGTTQKLVGNFKWVASEKPVELWIETKRSLKKCEPLVNERQERF